MARYIDTDKIEYIKAPIAALIKGDAISWQDIAFKSGIDNIPTADVQEAKHGKWVFVDNAYGTECLCDNCQMGVRQYRNQPYCSECGAKMDEECEKTKQY